MKASADRAAAQPDHRQADGQDRLGPELGGDPRRRVQPSAARTGTSTTSRRTCYGQFENTFMMYLPRLCEHCLNPACVASLPVGLDLQARGRRHRADRPGQVPRLAHVRVAAARTRRSTTTGRAARPRSASSAIRASKPASPPCARETCVGRIRYLGVLLYDADRIQEAASVEHDRDLYQAQLRHLPRPERPEGDRAGARSTASPTTGWKRARKSPVYKMAVEWKVALPLHPEYRTLPMVWYVPPLSPISAAANAGHAGHQRRDPRRQAAAHPGQVPGQPADRRRHRAGGARARTHAGDARLPARQACRRHASTWRC